MSSREHRERAWELGQIRALQSCMGVKSGA